MKELSDKLNAEELATFSAPVVGMTRSNYPSQEIVIANYFDPGFAIYGVVDEGLKLQQFIGNNHRVTFDGGKEVKLFDNDGSRAQVAQLANDGKTLLYLAGGGRFLGALDLDSGKVLPKIGPIAGERGEYFLQLRDNTIATIEGFQNAVVRSYEIRDNSLNQIDELNTSNSFVYGLAQDNDNQLIYLIPEQGTYPFASYNQPGVYRIDMEKSMFGRKRLDSSFAGKMPKDARGLAPFFKDGKLDGYFVSTYGFNRMKVNGGDPSKLFYIRKLK